MGTLAQAVGERNDRLTQQAAPLAYALGDGTLGYDSPTPEVVSFDDEAMCATFCVSAAVMDREGDVVTPAGIDVSHWAQNPVWLWDHDTSEPPIGTGLGPTGQLGWQIKGDRAYATCWFHRETERAREAYQLVKRGVLKGTSIGFMGRKGQKVRTGLDGIDDARVGWRFDTAELLEISLVCVPTCREAAEVTKALKLLTPPRRLLVTGWRGKALVTRSDLAAMAKGADHSNPHGLWTYRCPECGGDAYNGDPAKGTTYRGSAVCKECGHGFAVVKTKPIWKPPEDDAMAPKGMSGSGDDEEDDDYRTAAATDTDDTPEGYEEEPALDGDGMDDMADADDMGDEDMDAEEPAEGDADEDMGEAEEEDSDELPGSQALTSLGEYFTAGVETVTDMLKQQENPKVKKALERVLADMQDSVEALGTLHAAEYGGADEDTPPDADPADDSEGDGGDDEDKREKALAAWRRRLKSARAWVERRGGTADVAIQKRVAALEAELKAANEEWGRIKGLVYRHTGLKAAKAV